MEMRILGFFVGLGFRVRSVTWHYSFVLSRLFAAFQVFVAQ